MSAILLALLAAVGFSGASLLALLGGELRAKGRSYSAAVAAGILLALAFVDLFPEGLEVAGEAAIVGFVGGFTLLFLTEAFTRAHTHHAPEESVHKHALGPFVLGLAIHNLADGFVLGVGATAGAVTAWLVGLGVLVHQIPVGISPAAALTVAFPAPEQGTLGLLTGVAGGVLAYIGAAHLLPEAQTEDTNRVAGILFVATLLITTVGLMLLGHG